jgi:hypothetical protein
MPEQLASHTVDEVQLGARGTVDGFVIALLCTMLVLLHRQVEHGLHVQAGPRTLEYDEITAAHQSPMNPPPRMAGGEEDRTPVLPT